jgi:hypothetical protein
MYEDTFELLVTTTCGEKAIQAKCKMYSIDSLLTDLTVLSELADRSYRTREEEA